MCAQRFLKMAHWAQLQGKSKEKKQQESYALPDELRMSGKEWCESWHQVPLSKPRVPAQWTSMSYKRKEAEEEEEEIVRVKKEENSIY